MSRPSTVQESGSRASPFLTRPWGLPKQGANHAPERKTGVAMPAGLSGLDSTVREGKVEEAASTPRKRHGNA